METLRPCKGFNIPRLLTRSSRPCPHLKLTYNVPQSRWRETRLYTTKTSKPLRILFCGSDEFSCESLRAVHALQQRNPQFIASIDVLCRPGKKSGRSMTQIREVPLKAVAQKLNLRIHERDTFTGWDLPKPQNESINLIIAVSFGLFVPPRILKSAEYGGLNIHPSMLPNFRGPAPLQHTIMTGQKTTGVTLQTLDETSFDHGVILAQTPAPGFIIPQPNTCTYTDLLEFIKPKAADLLVQGLEDRVFVPPLVDARPKPLIRASKITPKDQEILWNEWDADEIVRRHRALGRLWCNILIDGKQKRMIFEDMQEIPMPNFPDTPEKVVERDPDILHDQERPELTTSRPENYFVYSRANGTVGRQYYVTTNNKSLSIIIIVKQSAIRVENITMEGKSAKDAGAVMRHIHSRMKEFEILRGNESKRQLDDEANKVSDGTSG